MPFGVKLLAQLLGDQDVVANLDGTLCVPHGHDSDLGVGLGQLALHEVVLML